MSIDDQALEIIWIEGGKAHVHRVAHKMNISFDYARSVLYSLGRRDFIDIGRDEIGFLTDKGKERLEKANFPDRYRDVQLAEEQDRLKWRNLQ